MTNTLPPRLKNWTQGKTQVGLFIHTKDGGVIEAVSNDASAETAKAASELFAAMIENGGRDGNQE